MAALTITPQGITLKSFQELREELKREWVCIFGDRIDLSPTSPDGLHIDLEAKTITSIAQAVQAIASNLNRNEAQGLYLDILASIIGLYRIKQTNAAIVLRFVKNGGSFIPAGTQVTPDDGLHIFKTLDSGTTPVDGRFSVQIKCEALEYGYVDLLSENHEWKVLTGDSEIRAYYESGGSGDYIYRGSDAETDAELRVRMNTHRVSGRATYETMLSYMQSVPGIQSVALLVNDEPDEQLISGVNLPGHSFMFILSANIDDNAIAQAIFDCKPAGIRSVGDQQGYAEDASERIHIQKWSQVSIIDCACRITITRYDEETLPDNYSDLIKASVMAFAETEFTSGKDIIPKRFFGPVYSVSGILDVNVFFSIDNGENWSEDPIKIDFLQSVKLQYGNIGVTLNG